MAYYFAYGSCMSLNDIKRTVADAKFVGAATLQDYELAFTKYSYGRKGGVADIVQRTGKKVEGIVFEVSDFESLDRREGVHINMYKRIPIELKLQESSGIMTAETYTVVQKEEADITPSEEYMEIILDGARKLSEEYRLYLQERFKRFKDELRRGE